MFPVLFDDFSAAASETNFAADAGDTAYDAVFGVGQHVVYLEIKKKWGRGC